MDDTMGRSSWNPEPKPAYPTTEERIKAVAAEAKADVGEVKRDLKEKIDETSRDLKRKASETWTDVSDKVDGYVNDNPKSVALGALGAGLVVGLLAGVLIERSSS